MNQKLQVSASPHTRGMMTTGKIMTMVTAALLPACVRGVLAFGCWFLSSRQLQRLRRSIVMRSFCIRALPYGTDLPWSPDS